MVLAFMDFSFFKIQNNVDLDNWFRIPISYCHLPLRENTSKFFFTILLYLPQFYLFFQRINVSKDLLWQLFSETFDMVILALKSFCKNWTGISIFAWKLFFSSYFYNRLIFNRNNRWMKFVIIGNLKIENNIYNYTDLIITSISILITNDNSCKCWIFPIREWEWNVSNYSSYLAK